MAHEDALEREPKKPHRISVWNWMGTLLLCAIPGVNIITMILFIICARTQPKRSFAIAGLILHVLLLAIVCAVFLLFPGWVSELATSLRGAAAAAAATPL